MPSANTNVAFILPGGRERLLMSAAVLLGLAGAAAGAGEDTEPLMLTGKKTVNLTWAVTDGSGMRWDIVNYGSVNDGTNDAYDGGMYLQLGGSNQSFGSKARLSEDGREIQLGPLRHGALQIWRRIYIDPKTGYARWVDFIQNKSSSRRTEKLQWYSNVGSSIQNIQTTTGGSSIGKKDWGFVTSSSSSSRPSLVHFFASRGSKDKPQVQVSTGNDNVYIRQTVDLQPGEVKAFCIIQAQRSSHADAVKFMENFRPEQSLKNLPPAVRKKITNMRGGMISYWKLELRRLREADLVVFTDGRELRGKIVAESYKLKTRFGVVELPASRVVGLVCTYPGDPQVHFLLTDGQVVAGTLATGAVEVAIPGPDNRVTVPIRKLDSASYRISAERPEEIRFNSPLLGLRCGQRLAFDPEGLDLSFNTEYGRIELTPEMLTGILLDTPDGGLHRAVFRNGSVLSGLLTVEQIDAPLELTGAAKTPRHWLNHLQFAAAPAPAADAAKVVLQNGDTLIGQLGSEDLKLLTNYSTVRLAPGQIERLDLAPDGSVQVTLYNGTRFAARLEGSVLPFRIGGGPMVGIFISHIAEATFPKGKAATKEPATDKAVSEDAKDAKTETAPPVARPR